MKAKIVQPAEARKISAFGEVASLMLGANDTGGIITLPSGFETFFSRCETEFGKETGPDPAKIVEISREHGIEYVDKP